MQSIFFYWREIFAFFSVSIAIYSYTTYIKGVFQGKTKPHIFSWGIWSLTTGIAFFAQLVGGGGWGSAQGGITMFVCLFIMFLAIQYGDLGKIDVLDWGTVLLSFAAIVLWLKTNNPFYGSFFAMFADAIGYIPTFRKVWHKPESEPSGYYLLMNVKHGLSLAALSQYTATTVIFSSSVIVINFFLIIIQYIRKKKLYAK